MAVGIVAVSHSLPLAEAARDLALQMISGEQPPLALAAGTPEGEFGTDAVAVAEAIAAVDSGDGVLVLVDLGSAILSAEMALEFLPDPDLDVRIISAPFVEGLLAGVVRAATGGSIDEVAEEARAALIPKQQQLGDTAEQPTVSVDTAATDEVRRTATIVNAAGLHARPAGRIAEELAQFNASVTIQKAGRDAVSARSPLMVAGLGTRGGDTVTLSANGADATAALDHLENMIADGFGELVENLVEQPAAAAAGADPQPVDARNHSAPTRPLGVSSGRVLGPVARMAAPVSEPIAHGTIAENERAAEKQRVIEAVTQVTAELEELAATATGTAQEVLAATAKLAADPVIISEAGAKIIDQGRPAANAVWDVLRDIARQFTAGGGELAERASDVRDVRARIVAKLTGQQLPGIPNLKQPFILVAHDLAPADTATLNPKTCLGIVLGSGGPTSHTAILARALGIPAVIDAAAFAELEDGEEIVIDGETAEVIRQPNDSDKLDARTAPQLLSDLPPFAGPGRLASGETVQILANVGSSKDVAAAVERGAEGVGLFRTEFCFLGRETAPSLTEQVAAYAEVLQGFKGRKVVVRTLDAGSDKPLPFVTPAAEENPALGVRGYRTSWNYPDVLTTQLAAIAQAATQVPETDVWVMAPMIATLEETHSFVEEARHAGLKHVGIMVETPAAVGLADQIAEVVDFVSVGTNDLAQYTMAADRMATDLAHLNSPWQPALLRQLRALGENCADTAVSIGVCGESASDPLLAGVLVGLGVNSLSMTANAVPVVGAAIAGYTMEQCQQAAAAACNAESAEAARRAVREILAA
ncbi:phosphoenolpyruvate--protein phosphotransferase [Canibacter zhoujuaniae]|uniref:phosphoenolpyruvate--protein phosphotransferase n=1 Tax=Canibacter zhoujuaniae TaxID=2708343 RepID=UPI00141DDA24|nr:phosphoenolpyruvate--protein phosphotransferase [Canibacter zhoujuaniae]